VPLVQAGSYAEKLAKVTLTVDTDDNTVCSATPEIMVMEDVTPDLSLPRVAAIDKIVKDAEARAEVVGAEVICTATAPISLPGGLMKPDIRNQESPASSMVAQMFYDVLGGDNPEFIGVQNPGGTRADLPAGEISYAAAAAVLPFANTLMTTQVTGAQVKTMLEQQWQTNADGSIPSRPYLQLGLSSNVTYTYDESRPLGERITSVAVNGQPIDPAKLYTVGSGSFLVTGGDNFRVLADGQNTRDTGASDLAAWVDWLTARQTVSPSFARGAVSVSPTPSTLAAGQSTTLQVGVPQGALQADTLDMRSTGAVANTQLVATLGDVQVGTAAVTDGRATLQVTVPAGTAKGAAVLVLKASPSGTTVSIPVTIA